MRKQIQKYLLQYRLWGIFFILAAVASLVLISSVLPSTTNTRGRASSLTPTPTASPTRTPAMPIILRDDKTGSALSLQLTSGILNPGQFDFLLPQTGDYRGIVPIYQPNIIVSIQSDYPFAKLFSSNSKVSLSKILQALQDPEVNQDMASTSYQLFFPFGKVNAQFYQPSGTSTAAVMYFVGIVNVTRNTGSIYIWVNNTLYHVVLVQGDITAATKAANQVSSAMATSNWTSLYSLLATQLKLSMTQSQFTQVMTGGNTPTIISAVLNGAGKTVNASGFTYFVQPITLTVRLSSGAQATYRNNLYFILEQGSWHLLSTDTPKP